MGLTCHSLDLASQLVHQQLHAIADAQHRDLLAVHVLKEALREAGCTLNVH